MAAIRKISRQDLDDLKAIIDSNELFPAELLNGMTKDFFSQENSSDIWYAREQDGKAVALAYCAPERMTDGIYNLYLIAVHKDMHGQGIGSELMAFLEALLAQKGARILIVETSGLPEFELTRKFYANLGYRKEATIREFYQKGEDKIVFWKKLVAE